MYKFLLFILPLFFVSCNRGKVNTPEEYINNVTVKAAQYSKDSISILDSLYMKMRNHEESFQNPEYFDSTKLYLDTIYYDSTLKKIVFFVIAENPVYRNSHSDSKLPFYYNANCYVGNRLISDSSNFKIKNIGPVSIINFDTRYSASKAIKESYNSELTTFLDADRKPHYDYNVNDERFWNSSKGWKRVFP